MIRLLLGDWQRMVLYGLIAAGVVAGLIGYGYHLGVRQLWEYQAAQARAAIPVVIRQGAVTQKIVTVYRDKIVKVKGDTEYITKEITKYVPPSADPVLPAGWLLLHDATATRSVPEAAPGVDVTAPAIAASQALKGVIGNYGQYFECAIQLMTLQDWLRHQYQTMNLEPLGY